MSELKYDFCDECKQKRLYCKECEIYHHQDNFDIEHKEFKDSIEEKP